MDIVEYRKGFVGIIPPKDDIAGGVPRNMREVVAKETLSLPFVKLSPLSAPATVPVRGAEKVENSHENPFLKSRSVARGVALHKNANDFCNRLNKATQNHSAMLKRRRDVDTKNTLMSTMGIVVQKKKK